MPNTKSLYIIENKQQKQPLGRRITSDDTLVKYGTPKLIACRQTSVSQLEQLQALIERSGGSTDEGCVPPEKPAACKETGLSKKEMEEILNYILPPNEWGFNRKHWRQTVSSDPSSRRDVIDVMDELNHRLDSGNAGNVGICESRRVLYAQCLDELIRQTTVRCAERGLMLFLCRQEFEFSLNAYKKLYISSGAYALRKTLLSVQASEHKNIDVDEIVARNETLRQEILEMEQHIVHEHHRFAEQKRIEDKQRADELEALRVRKMQLQGELEMLLINGRRLPFTV